MTVWYVQTGADPTAVGPATSCEAADVQRALEYSGIATSGDTVKMAAGTCTWLSSIAYGNNKDITLSGAGNVATGVSCGTDTNGATKTALCGAATVDGTTIKLRYTAGVASAFVYFFDYSVIIEESTTGHNRLTNIYFIRESDAPAMPRGHAFVLLPNTHGTGNPEQIAIFDHLTFEWHQSAEGFTSYASLHGLFTFNRIFNDNLGAGLANTGPTISIAGSTPLADNNWAAASTWGMLDTNGDRAVYIETNLYENNGLATDTDSGGRSVIRYNDFKNTVLNNHGHDTSAIGVRTEEIYNNYFHCGSDFGHSAWWGARGSSTVITDNVLPSTCFGRSLTRLIVYQYALRELDYFSALPPFSGTANGAAHAVITGITSTAGLGVGQLIFYTAPALGSAKILTVDSATQITLNDRLTGDFDANGAQTLVLITCNTAGYPWARQHGWGWAGFGDMSNQILEPDYIWNNKFTTGGTPGEADLLVGTDTLFAGVNGPCAWPTLTGTKLDGSTDITAIAEGTAAYFAAGAIANSTGLRVTGTGVPANTTITSVLSSNSIRLSNPVTGNGAIALTLDNNHHVTWDPDHVANGTTDYVREGREYYMSTTVGGETGRPGYTKYTYPHPLALPLLVTTASTTPVPSGRSSPRNLFRIRRRRW